MSTHSKKDTESHMYCDVFGDLSALASDDSGEINSFANEVMNREVVAGNWRENLVEFGSDAFRWLKNRGDRDKIKADQLFKREQATDKVLNAVEKGQYARALKSPQVYHIFEAEINKQALDIVNRTIAVTKKSDANLAKTMENQKEDLVARVKNLVTVAINKGEIYTNNNDLIINIQTPLKTKGLPDIKVSTINLNRSDFERRVDELKIKKTETSKEYAEVQKRIDSRPKPTKGQVGQDKQGRKYVYNGVKWVLLAGAALTVWQNKDELPDIVDSFRNPNSDVKVDTGQSSYVAPEPKNNQYDLSGAHDTSSEILNNVNPGGANPNQAPKVYGQDAWDKLKSPSSTQRKKFESVDRNDWWNTSSTSKPTYDDMGYIGGSDESWSRTAQKISPHEMDEAGLSNYGADQLLAAQNFLSYYGLGTNKQPGEQIIPSLLMGNFGGMSFDEYKSKHSEEEVRQAMQKFEQGLSMFSEEMTKLANNLESFYQERQRRSEVQKSQPVQQSNEDSQRTE